MSYCRWGADSDVYVFTTRKDIECCGCILQEREWVEEPDNKWFGGYFKAVGEIIQTTFTSNAGMIEHLEKHVAAGHQVPDYAFERLRDPADADKNIAVWAKYTEEENAT